MRRIVVMTTGGTIAVKQGPMVGGAVPVLKGDDFLALLPRDEVELVFEEFANVPSSHFTPARALELAQRIELLLMAPDVDGVVVSHGTDTLEETAYLLDLTLNSMKPVVVTSSLRPVTSAGYDGIANLSNAIRVAAAPQARELGVLVLVDEQIFAASEVQQLDSQTVQAFQAPETGPLGRIQGKTLRFAHHPQRRQYIPSSRLEAGVVLLRLVQGMDDQLLRHCITDQVPGIVLETFGSGRVPPWFMPTLYEAAEQRIVLAVTSRCVAGGLGDDYGYVGAYHDLRRLGVLFAPHLNGIKTRIKLMVAMGAARSRDELRLWFQ